MAMPFSGWLASAIGFDPEILLRASLRSAPRPPEIGKGAGDDARSARPNSCPTLLESWDLWCPPFSGGPVRFLPLPPNSLVFAALYPARPSVAAMGISASQVQKTLTFRFCEEKT